MTTYDVTQLTGAHNRRLRDLLGKRFNLLPGRISDEQIPVFFEHITLGDLSGMAVADKNFFSTCYNRMTKVKPETMSDSEASGFDNGSQ